MRSYASISPMFWTRGSGKALRGDPNAQVVALYLMSSPATSMIGIFHLALPTLCHETGLGLQAARKGLARCLEEGIAFWDETEELVFVPALAKHQIGEQLKASDHKVKGVARELAPFKGHRFFRLFCERYSSTYHLPNEWLDSPIQGASESLGRDDVPVLSCPDPESAPHAVADSAPDPVREVFEFWQVDTGHKQAKLTDEKRKHIAARLKDFSVDQLKQVVINRHLNPHYMGQNDSKTVYDGIDNLFRNTERVEKLLALSQRKNTPGGLVLVPPAEAEARARRAAEVEARAAAARQA